MNILLLAVPIILVLLALSFLLGKIPAIRMQKIATVFSRIILTTLTLLALWTLVVVVEILLYWW